MFVVSIYKYINKYLKTNYFIDKKFSVASLFCLKLLNFT